MRVVLFAPTASSLYSRLIAHELIHMPEVELAAVFVRRLWSAKRIRVDLRREGPRLLQKINAKLVLGEGRNPIDPQTALEVLAAARGLDFKDLADFGRRNRIPCKTVDDFNSESCRVRLEALAPDLIVFTGGGLIRQQILEIPVLGVLNCHSGLLPRYRGMDTLEWALLEAGQKAPIVGLTLHFMDSGVDTGPILRQHLENIRPGDTLEGIRKRLEPEMVRLISTGVRDLQQGTLQAVAQERSAGRQYFVIHPRLQERAVRRLARGW